MKLTDAHVEEFWKRVNKDGPVIREELGPCWEWTGYRIVKGYGCLWIPELQKYVYAHRVSHEIHNGPLGENQCCHRCDYPPCIRPEHLFGGTQQENTQDAVKKMRMLVGTKNGAHKLSETQVRSIRLYAENGWKYSKIGENFCIGIATVHNIVKRKYWAHVR